MGKHPCNGFATDAAPFPSCCACRDVWTIPWLEGDDALWHLQPRVSMMLEQVKNAAEQQLGGVLATHRRTEETRANLEAFAVARDPEGAPTLESFYEDYCKREYGKAAAESIARILVRLDKAQTRFASPEYFPYEPGWGRMNDAARIQWTQDLSALRATADLPGSRSQHRNLNSLAAAFEFTLLLDEVGRRIEPAYLLKRDSLLGRVSAETMVSRAAQAHAEFERAPIEALFRTYASRVRSKGELGVLSSLNQRVWLEYQELREFLNKTARRNGASAGR